MLSEIEAEAAAQTLKPTVPAVGFNDANGFGV